MITNQLIVDQNTLQQAEILAQNEIGTAEKRKPQRRFSATHQRVTIESAKIFDQQKEQMRNEALSKTKVHRRDTKETDLTVSQMSVLIQEPGKDPKMDELLKKSQNDPFLRRKLKNQMESDIKSLKRMNSKSSVTANESINNSILGTSLQKKQVGLNSTQIIDNEYKNIPRDISMVLNTSVLLKRNSSMNDINVAKLPPKPRNSRVTIEQNSVIITGSNPTTPKQQFTTLRRESYKTNISRLQVLREMEEKAVTEYVLDQFTTKANIQNVAKLSKIPMIFKK